MSLSTEVLVEADPEGVRARVRLLEGGLRPSLLASDGSGARVAMTPTGALLLGGDHVRIGLTVGPGAWLELVEPSGTVAYDMRGGCARWDVDVRLEAGARLRWRGEPFVVAHGAQVSRRTSVTLATDATCCLLEALVLGRAGEPPGEVVSTTRVNRAGIPILIEDLSLGRASAAPGLLGRHRVMETLALLGTWAPPVTVPAGTVRLDLAQPGTLLRSLSRNLHESRAASMWLPWSALAEVPPSRPPVSCADTTRVA